MRLMHFSDQLTTKEMLRQDMEAYLLERNQGRGSEKQLADWLDYHRYHKPLGLWVSDEDDYGWRSWCLDNDFRIENLRYAHKVELEPGANILHLKSKHEIAEFGLFWKSRAEPFRSMEREIRLKLPGHQPHIYSLNWPEIRKRYDGILITPYQYTIFDPILDRHMWYYGWDCASGCVWNFEAIKSIRRVGYGRLPQNRKR
jgi:hypothetical protein